MLHSLALQHSMLRNSKAELSHLGTVTPTIKTTDFEIYVWSVFWSSYAHISKHLKQQVSDITYKAASSVQM